MKLNPIFNTESNIYTDQKGVIKKLSPAAEYAKELYRDGFKMQWALRRAAFEYGVDIHTIAKELGHRGGKTKKRRRLINGNKN